MLAAFEPQTRMSEEAEIVYFREMATSKKRSVASRAEKPAEPRTNEWTRDQKLTLGGIIVGIIAIAIAYSAWWQPQRKQQEDENHWLQVDKHVDEKLSPLSSKLQEHSDLIHEMNGTLKTLVQLEGVSVAEKINKTVGLPDRAFNEEGSQLIPVVDTAARYGIDVPGDSIRQWSDRMMKLHPELAPFVMAAVVNYGTSEALAWAGLFEKVSTTIAPCISNSPGFVSGGAPSKVDGEEHVYKLNLKEFRDCTQVLDGTTWDSVKFVHCLLRYRGGKVGWGIVFFEGSLIRIELPNAVEPEAQELVAKLFPQKGPNLQLRRQ